MALSETDIANSALVKLGTNTITSLSDNSKEGRLCNLRYHYIRDELLRSHPWNFAKKRISLAVSTTVPAYYYTQQFPLPPDYIRMLDNDLQEDQQWVIEGSNFLCFSTSLNILYIFKQTDTTQYDELFESALAWRLASELAYGLVQSSALAKTCWEAYTETLKLARSVNAQERGALQQVTADDWSSARVKSGTFGFGSDPSKL